jgi:hypothetical protein
MDASIGASHHPMRIVDQASEELGARACFERARLLAAL